MLDKILEFLRNIISDILGALLIFTIMLIAWYILGALVFIADLLIT